MSKKHLDKKRTTQSPGSPSKSATTGGPVREGSVPTAEVAEGLASGPSGSPLPALSPRPKEMNEARDSLSLSLGGAQVATSHGFSGVAGDRVGRWQLVVFTDDPGLAVPSKHMGIPVVRRPVPHAQLRQPVWGKAAGASKSAELAAAREREAEALQIGRGGVSAGGDRDVTGGEGEREGER